MPIHADVKEFIVALIAELNTTQSYITLIHFMPNVMPQDVSLKAATFYFKILI